VTAFTLEQFRTPRGRAASLYTRDETADHNNVYSCMTEDEYGLAGLTFADGDTALDIGAHIGGVSIGLALDNKNLHVVAVEALSANVEMLYRNIEANGVGDRVTVRHGAAERPGKKSATVRWNFEKSESGQHHRFIANAHNVTTPTDGESEEVDALSLDALIDGPVAFMKIDCEGCEYDVLRSSAVASVTEIRGEFHNGFEQVFEMLAPTHNVFLTSGTEAFGGFKAVHR
jgi:FkbM family methyltransferase